MRRVQFPTSGTDHFCPGTNSRGQRRDPSSHGPSRRRRTDVPDVFAVFATSVRRYHAVRSGSRTFPRPCNARGSRYRGIALHESLDGRDRASNKRVRWRFLLRVRASEHQATPILDAGPWPRNPQRRRDGATTGERCRVHSSTDAIAGLSEPLRPSFHRPRRVR
jgi:hypothetical protein